jgi:hypothetical protein
MSDIIVPCVIEAASKVGSKDLVKAFLASDCEMGEISIADTKRSADSVYAALLVYLKRHPSLGVSVRMIEKKIVLVRGVRTGDGPAQ